VVFSRHASPADALPGVEYVSGAIGAFVSRLREEPGKDIWLMGGGELIAAFLDEHAIDDFVTRELGALAGPEHALLRETLRVYLDCGGSAPRAASTLRTHRNTVLYRLRHAAPLVGHPLDERRLELALALRLEAASRVPAAGRRAA
jgi:DNA-binding PucR family transcriptional regulator